MTIHIRTCNMKVLMKVRFKFIFMKNRESIFMKFFRPWYSQFTILTIRRPENSGKRQITREKLEFQSYF